MLEVDPVKQDHDLINCLRRDLFSYEQQLLMIQTDLQLAQQNVSYNCSLTLSLCSVLWFWVAQIASILDCQPRSRWFKYSPWQKFVWSFLLHYHPLMYSSIKWVLWSCIVKEKIKKWRWWFTTWPYMPNQNESKWVAETLHPRLPFRVA